MQNTPERKVRDMEKISREELMGVTGLDENDLEAVTGGSEIWDNIQAGDWVRVNDVPAGAHDSNAVMVAYKVITRRKASVELREYRLVRNENGYSVTIGHLFGARLSKCRPEHEPHWGNYEQLTW